MTASDWPDGPTIETARLRLRPHRLADRDARLSITASAGMTRFVGGPQSPEENWSRLLRSAGHWALLGHGFFAVEERASGRLAGEVGLADFQRGLGDDFDPYPEAGWILADWAAGRGFAREAVGAAMAWHIRRFGAVRMVCIIDPGNAPSLRLAAKLGFAPFRDATYKDHRVILHERPPDVHAASTI